MTVKRRTIWLSDADWAATNHEARGNGQTVSAYIRSLICDLDQVPATIIHTVVSGDTGGGSGGPGATFVSYNPAPKPGKK